MAFFNLLTSCLLGWLLTVCSEGLISKESRSDDTVGAMVGDLVGGLVIACCGGCVVSQSVGVVVVEYPMPVAPEVQGWICGIGSVVAAMVGRWLDACCVSLGYSPSIS